MAKTVAVQYIGGHDSVDMPTLGIQVERLGVIEVSADVAGHQASDWHPVTDADDADWPRMTAAEPGPDGEVVWLTQDPGSGLLAQPDNWLPVKANPAKPAAPVVTPEA
jgi:hypothetical protein